MGIIIRLDAIPLTGLPQIVKSDPVDPARSRVNCVLHSQALPAHQSLEVRVNDVLQQQVAEGDSIVCCWQLTKASEKVHISLLNRGVVMTSWQGCWNERDAILHFGTLPVQVFFDGKLQPTVAAVGGSTSAATLADMQRVAAEGNGNGPAVVLSRLDHGSAEPDRPAGTPPPSSAVVVVQDLLVLAEPRPPSNARLAEVSEAVEGAGEVRENGRDEVREDEAEEVSVEEGEEAKEDGLNEREEDEQEMLEEAELGEVGEEKTEKLEEDWGEEVEEDELNEREGVEEDELYERKEEEPEGEESLEERELMVMQEEQPPVAALTATGPRLAAFHASPVASTFEALKALMEGMPPKTLLIDLRRHSRTNKKYQRQGSLSKDHLRATFGGKYWDRGWAIQTTYHQEPTAGVRHPRWRQVLVHPEHAPDGLPSFCEHLQEGYSLVVMDSLASYAESPRRAVIEALQNHCTNLVVGPLG